MTHRISLLASLLSFLALGCVPEYPEPRDPVGAYNASGGATRANSYPGIVVPPFEVVRERQLKSGLHGGVQCAPLEIDRRVVVITGGEGRIPPMLAFLTRDSLLWKLPFDDKDPPLPSLAADSVGTIYTITLSGVLRATSLEGKMLWSHPTMGQGEGIAVPSPVLALADGAIAANTRGEVQRFDRSGRSLWKGSFGASISDPPAASPALGVVLALTHNDYDLSDTLVALDPATGARRWTRPLIGGRIVAGPALVGERVLVGVQRQKETGAFAPSLMAVDSKGTVSWERPLPLTPRGICADTGLIAVACSGTSLDHAGGALVGLDMGGREVWRRGFESGLPSAPAITGQRLFIFALRDGRAGIYAIARDGTIERFASLDRVPEVRGAITLSAAGELLLAALQVPSLVMGG